MELSPIPWLLVIPMFWAVLSLLLPARWEDWIALPGVAIQILAAGALLQGLLSAGPQHYALGDWPAPLGITLASDGLAVTFVMLTALVATACAVCMPVYRRKEPAAYRYFWPLVWFLWAALNTIWFSADIFNLYVGLEMMSLAAAGLVALTGSTPATAAAMRYLLAALFGSLAYLLGVALLYGAYGTLSLHQLSSLAQPGVTTLIALGIMVAGLLFKTALFPLHGWLPPAHSNALTPASVLLSALVVEAPFYILLRLWINLGPGLSTAAAQLLGFLGTGAVIWGSWMALKELQLKMLVAYSTVAQIGYLFLFFPLMTGTAPETARLAWDGTLLYAVSHATAKAAMFLAAGSLILATGSPEVRSLAGTSGLRPLSLASFGLASMTLMGLPPSGGFTAKWLLLQSVLTSGQWWWLPALLLGGLLTAAYVFRVFYVSFLPNPHGNAFRHPPLTLELAALMLALTGLPLGLAAAGILTLMRTGVSL